MPNTDLQRAPLLEAQVEIEIAAGNIARARAAADELTRVAARFESKALVAGATLAHGRVRLAEGDSAEAERLCAEAARLWSAVGGRTRRRWRARLTEIEDDIEQARSFGDTERAAQADAERDFLLRELSRAVGLGGRDRRAASTSERARVSVTRAIRQAIARVGEHQRLREHLEQTIRTGTYCAYVPDARRPADRSS